jgi:peptidoglycan/LPS O-acetylase OafA/YrhL
MNGLTTEQTAVTRSRAGHPRHRAPGLDGVRALAVLAVLAFHEGLRGAPGGFLGVDVFFVLSGYLITDLLVTQRGRLGRLDLRSFWTRRARRLLPALAVVLIVVTAVVAVVEPDQLAGLRPALLAAVTYSSNWFQALHHMSYFASFGPPPPLQHLWSLAIEEQFYLAWPLILGLMLTQVSDRLVRAAFAWLGAVISALLMAIFYAHGGDPSRVYYGTDTHATALLVGAALALTWPLGRVAAAPREVTRRLDFLGMAGLVVLAWAVGHFSGADPVVYPAGLALAALAAGALVLAAAAHGAVGGFLSLPPLRWLGIRSYGIYLWHWPVIALAAAASGPGPAAPWLWVVEAGLAIVLAAASWKWIEAPILRDGFRATLGAYRRLLSESIRAARQSPVHVLPALAAVAAATVACTAGYGVLNPPAPQTSSLMRQVAQGERVSAASQAQPAPRTVSGATPAPGPAPATGTARHRRIPGWQVTAIGDSVMLASAVQLQSVLPGIYIDAQVSRQMGAGVADVKILAGRGRLRPVVVVGLGTNGTVTGGQIRQLVREIGPRRTLVLVNTYEARPWEHADNRVLAAAARRYPNVVLADWLATIEHHRSLLWGDGVHPRPPGARLYARMLAAAIEGGGPPRNAAPASAIPPAPGGLPRLAPGRLAP